tara:strand:+ start:933 stop:1169 length:237 start_codon:yes stop_codon:yes gene_type:complete
MPSSERKDRAESESKIIYDILKKLPSEINGGMVAALLVNILFRYGMEEEWEKIVAAVDETMEDIETVQVVDVKEVHLN